jgi:hypothetical protein
MAETVLGPSYAGSVVLDIGGDTGALVIHTGSGMLGREIEVSGPVATHSVVRERLIPGGVRYAAVFPGLPAGSYRLSVHGHRDALPTASVVGGQVAEVTCLT